MLPWKNWVTLNRFRSNVRKCMSNLKKWGIINYAKRYYSFINCGGFIGWGGGLWGKNPKNIFNEPYFQRTSTN